MAAVHGQNAEEKSSPRAVDRTVHLGVRWGVIAICALAFALRVIALGSKSVFADEAASIRFAKLDWLSFWHLIWHSEANMALYYVLLRFWVRLGDGPAAVRFLSVLPGVATVPVIYLLGKELFSPRSGLIAGLLFAVNGFHVAYSQAARGYSLAVLLVTLSSYFFVQAIKSPPRASRVAALYLLTSAASLYAHLFAGFVLGAQCVALAFSRFTRAQLARQSAGMLLVVLLSCPLLLFTARKGSSPLAWVQHPTAMDVYHFVTYLTGSGLKLLLYAAAFFLALAEWRRRIRDAGMSWPFVFVACWLVLPIFCTLAISHWVPVFSPRFLLICLPASVLLGSEGLAEIPRPGMRTVTTGLLIVSSLLSLKSYYHQPGIEDWKGATEYLVGRLGRQDAIGFTSAYNLAPFEYYVQHSGTVLESRNFIVGPPIAHAIASSRTRSPERIWVMLCDEPDHAEIVLPPASSYVRQQTAHFHGVEVVEFVRGGSC